MTELKAGTYDSFYTVHGEPEVYADVFHITVDPESPDRSAFWARSSVVREGKLRSVYLTLGSVGIEGGWVEYGVEGAPRIGAVTFYQVEQVAQVDRGDMYYGTWGLYGRKDVSGTWVLCARTVIEGASD